MYTTGGHQHSVVYFKMSLKTFHSLKRNIANYLSVACSMKQVHQTRQDSIGNLTQYHRVLMALGQTTKRNLAHLENLRHVTVPKE